MERGEGEEERAKGMETALKTRLCKKADAAVRRGGAGASRAN